MVTALCYRGYCTTFPWLPHYVTVVTALRFHGYRTMLPWLLHYVTMVTALCYHGYCTMLPWLHTLLHGYRCSIYSLT
jgi:hypothetical protein